LNSSKFYGEIYSNLDDDRRVEAHPLEGVARRPAGAAAFVYRPALRALGGPPRPVKYSEVF
jgi:hypothetical protein